MAFAGGSGNISKRGWGWRRCFECCKERAGGGVMFMNITTTILTRQNSCCLAQSVSVIESVHSLLSTAWKPDKSFSIDTKIIIICKKYLDWS